MIKHGTLYGKGRSRTTVQIQEEVAMSYRLHVGNPTVFETYADRTPFGAVFEDDGKVAYLYALDTRRSTDCIVDSVWIYDVSALNTRPQADGDALDVFAEHAVDLVWSPDQQRVVLLLDGQPKAAFDFECHRGYCRANFPASSAWSPSGHAWDDRVVDFLAG
jgi:hypothetical protein